MADEIPNVVEVTLESFETDVIGRSMEVPVIVDFWADWCEPCKQLAPLLDKLATEFGSRLVLAKVNIDTCPQLAQAFGVQSIPFVVAVFQGQPVDHFMGIKPEAELRQWIGRLLPSPAEEAFQAGEELEATDPEAAAIKYRDAIQLEPEEPRYMIAMARVALALGKEQEASELIERLEQRGFLEPEAQRLKEQLAALADVEESGGLGQAREAAEADPGNLQLQIALANALAAEKKYQEACDVCLNVIERDKFGPAGADAKETMVRILDMMGHGSELASAYRRRLATAFY